MASVERDLVNVPNFPNTRPNNNPVMRDRQMIIDDIMVEQHREKLHYGTAHPRDYDDNTTPRSNVKKLSNVKHEGHRPQSLPYEPFGKKKVPDPFIHTLLDDDDELPQFIDYQVDDPEYRLINTQTVPIGRLAPDIEAKLSQRALEIEAEKAAYNEWMAYQSRMAEPKPFWPEWWNPLNPNAVFLGTLAWSYWTRPPIEEFSMPSHIKDTKSLVRRGIWCSIPALACLALDWFSTRGVVAGILTYPVNFVTDGVYLGSRIALAAATHIGFGIFHRWYQLYLVRTGQLVLRDDEEQLRAEGMLQPLVGSALPQPLRTKARQHKIRKAQRKAVLKARDAASATTPHSLYAHDILNEPHHRETQGQQGSIIVPPVNATQSDVGHLIPLAGPGMRPIDQSHIPQHVNDDDDDDNDDNTTTIDSDINENIHQDDNTALSSSSSSHVPPPPSRDPRLIRPTAPHRNPAAKPLPPVPSLIEKDVISPDTYQGSTHYDTSPFTALPREVDDSDDNNNNNNNNPDTLTTTTPTPISSSLHHTTINGDDSDAQHHHNINESTDGGYTTDGSLFNVDTPTASDHDHIPDSKVYETTTTLTNTTTNTTVPHTSDSIPNNNHNHTSSSPVLSASPTTTLNQAQPAAPEMAPIHNIDTQQSSMPQPHGTDDPSAAPSTPILQTTPQEVPLNQPLPGRNSDEEVLSSPIHEAGHDHVVTPLPGPIRETTPPEISSSDPIPVDTSVSPLNSTHDEQLSPLDPIIETSPSTTHPHENVPSPLPSTSHHEVVSSPDPLRETLPPGDPDLPLARNMAHVSSTESEINPPSDDTTNDASISSTSPEPQQSQDIDIQE